MFEEFDPPEPGCGNDLQSGSLARTVVRTASVDGFVGPPDGALLDALTDVDPANISAELRVKYLGACARLESRVTALKLLAVEAVSRAEAVEQAEFFGSGVADVPDAGREVVMIALRVSGVGASALIEQSRSLIGNCPQTLYHLSEGLISPGVARVIADEVVHLDGQQVQQVESHVLVRAGHQTPADARRCVVRAVARVAPDAATKKHDEAVKDRNVQVIPMPHAMALFQALLPAPIAMDLFAMVDADARLAKGRARVRMTDSNGKVGELDSIDAYRADAFVALMQNSGRRSNDLDQADNQPTTPRQANIVIDLPTLLGLDDQPGELEGYGPIPANLARQLAKDATWQRWITEPTTGHLLELGRTRYLPNTQLREYICARDQVCRFPHCNQPAKRNDIDHAIPWDTGGQSNPDNLGSLCRRHHRLKTFNRWQITESHADGTCVWRSPAGHTITTEPPLPLEPTPIE